MIETQFQEQYKQEGIDNREKAYTAKKRSIAAGIRRDLSQTDIEFDFDVHDEKSYYRFFVNEYMKMTYRGLLETDYQFKGKTIFDIGVGRGRAFPIYKALGITRVVGFDVEEDEVAFAREKAQKFGIDLEIRMNPNNRELEKVPNASVDIVSMMYVLMCVPPEIKNGMIHHAKRILKSGGIIIIMDVPSPSLMSGLNRLAGMPRTFSSFREWQELLHPFRLVTKRGSNYWYFLNKPMDTLGRTFGTKAYKVLDAIPKTLRVTPSTALMVFQKE